MNAPAILALVLVIISIVLACIDRSIASPTYILWLAIFVVLFTAAKWPW